jgi:hypothetical protein
MTHKIFFSLGLFFFFCTIKAQEAIPFRITKYNNLIIKTLVNNKDSLDLMFQIAMKDALFHLNAPEKLTTFFLKLRSAMEIR